MTVLVDGDDALARLGGRAFAGFDPGEILDSGALVATGEPRRVAVYQCECGIAGCGVVAPLIEERQGQVRWSDFRDYTGVFVGPTVDEAPAGGKRLRAAAISFDAGQYRDEVERAMRDRSWETADRAAARLLRAKLLDAPELRSRGYRCGWVAPHWESVDVFEVSLVDDGGQTVLDISAEPGTPDARAEEMAERILGSSLEDWPVRVRNTWDPDLASED